MFVPKDLYTVPQVMAATGYRAEEVLQWGATGDVFFVVMAMNATGQLGPCKVTPAALMHFVAGAESYMVDAMPEVYSGDMFGPWKIERDKLLIVAKSWDAFHYNDRNSPPVFTRTARPTEDIPLPVLPAASSVSDERVFCEVQAAPGPELLLKRHLEGVKMFAPSMLNMADVMADSGYTEEAIFDCGISGHIVFLVVVPVIGACRVPVEALSHFMAGDDDYIAEGMPEHWSGALSDKWTIKRDRLRILGSSWNIFSDDCDKLAEAWAAATLAPAIDDGLDLPLAEQYKRNARDSIATGRCTLHEAVEILCIEAGEDNCVILRKLEAAAKSGLLPVFDRGRNARNEYEEYARVRVLETEAYCDDLNKWIEANEPRVDYRFPVPLAVTLSTASVVAEVFDFDMVATRKQLIDAFGKFTGMDMTWFDNLKDSPKLKAARKCTGQAGRRGAEPLFCPYEVMQWLSDPKRKKGRKINESTAWRLLKRSFGKVYDLHSIGDPDAN